LQRTSHAPLPKKESNSGGSPYTQNFPDKKKRQLLGSLLKDSFHTFPGLVPKLNNNNNITYFLHFWMIIYYYYYRQVDCHHR